MVHFTEKSVSVLNIVAALLFALGVGGIAFELTNPPHSVFYLNSTVRLWLAVLFWTILAHGVSLLILIYRIRPHMLSILVGFLTLLVTAFSSYAFFGLSSHASLDFTAIRRIAFFDLFVFQVRGVVAYLISLILPISIGIMSLVLLGRKRFALSLHVSLGLALFLVNSALIVYLFTSLFTFRPL